MHLQFIRNEYEKGPCLLAGGAGVSWCLILASAVKENTGIKNDWDERFWR